MLEQKYDIEQKQAEINDHIINSFVKLVEINQLTIETLKDINKRLILLEKRITTDVIAPQTTIQQKPQEKIQEKPPYVSHKTIPFRRP